MNINKADKSKRFTTIALIVSLSVGTSFSGYVHADRCDIDRDMRLMLEEVNQAEDRIIDDGVRTPVSNAIGGMDVKKGACLPALDAFDGLMRMRMPSMGAMLGGFINMVKKMACNFANSFLEQEINGISLGWGDPYGVFHIGVGGTTHGNGGFTTESYDVSKIVGDAAIGAIGGALGGIANGAGGISSGISGPKDRIPRIEDTINNGVRDAFKGL